MKFLKALAFAFLIIGSVGHASEEFDENSEALAEFEDLVGKQKEFMDSILAGEHIFPYLIQQYDKDATEVKFNEFPMQYKAAVTDAFYGYQLFMLVDKSVSTKAGKARDGKQRKAQTMYIYTRTNQNQLQLHSVHPVSTGKEPSPKVSDTREGFTRIQSAQATYTSKKYGEAMPFSLWFESEYGTAIHQTLQSRCDSLIGKRASAGCIRLCPGEAEDVFRLVTSGQYPRSSAIVLMDKRTGIPLARGTDKMISQAKDQNGNYVSLPKVIKGYPVFVRIIDGNTPEKIKEIEDIIENPTQGFRKYFVPVSKEALEQLTI